MLRSASNGLSGSENCSWNGGISSSSSSSSKYRLLFFVIGLMIGAAGIESVDSDDTFDSCDDVKGIVSSEKMSRMPWESTGISCTLCPPTLCNPQKGRSSDRRSVRDSVYIAEAERAGVGS